MQPTVGRIVHVTSGSECQAALVTKVGADENVRVTIFPPDGGPRASLDWWPHSELEFHDKTWHWPERVTE